jgi:RimJ/RimL family protein N-acetyltransferase
MGMKRLRALLRPLFARQVYQCLTLDWNQALQPRTEVTERTPPVEVRPLERAELARLSADHAYGISPEFLDGIARRDDRCFGAFCGDELASYAFFAQAAPTAIDRELRFSFPAQWIYLYKCFTVPAWRGRRLLPLVVYRAFPQLQAWRREESGGFVTLVLTENHASLRAIERCGFRKGPQFPVWRLGSSRPRLGGPAELARPEFSISVAL